MTRLDQVSPTSPFETPLDPDDLGTRRRNVERSIAEKCAELAAQPTNANGYLTNPSAADGAAEITTD